MNPALATESLNIMAKPVCQKNLKRDPNEQMSPKDSVNEPDSEYSAEEPGDGGQENYRLPYSDVSGVTSHAVGDSGSFDR